MDERTRLLAVDYGERRVGLAISDPTRTIASPAGFISRRAGKRPPIAQIIRQADALGASGFVLGLPIDSAGDETPRSLEVRHIGEELRRRTGFPVVFVDERFSTAAALRAIREMGGSTRDRKGDVDSLAATILLQQHLGMRPANADVLSEDVAEEAPDLAATSDAARSDAERGDAVRGDAVRGGVSSDAVFGEAASGASGSVREIRGSPVPASGHASDQRPSTSDGEHPRSE